MESIKNFAFKLHDDAGCTYGDGLAYSTHLNLANYFFKKYKYYLAPVVRIDVEKAIWCHDTLEDCEISMQYLSDTIGQVAANIVYNISDEAGCNRKDRMLKTLPKIGSTYESIFAKLCDRLANVSYSLNQKVGNGQSKKYDMYSEEYPTFRFFLRKNGWFKDMWDELDVLLCYSDNSILKIIDEKVNDREKIYQQYENSFDHNTLMYSEQEPVMIDTLADEIFSLLLSNKDTLPVDFIIETLTKLGHAPNILYDDNGLFAVDVCAFQPLVTDESTDDVSMNFIVNKNIWKPTIREAIAYNLQLISKK